MKNKENLFKNVSIIIESNWKHCGKEKWLIMSKCLFLPRQNTAPGWPTDRQTDCPTQWLLYTPFFFEDGIMQVYSLDRVENIVAKRRICSSCRWSTIWCFLAKHMLFLIVTVSSNNCFAFWPQIPLWKQSSTLQPLNQHIYVGLCFQFSVCFNYFLRCLQSS